MRIDLSRIRALLEDLPIDLRRAPGVRLYEVGDEVVYPWLFDETSALTLREATNALSDLAQDHLDRGCVDFIRLLIDEPRSVECGLVLVASYLSRSTSTPRDQVFYPSILLDRDVISVVKSGGMNDNPAIDVVWTLLGAREPGLALNISRAASSLKEGFGSSVRWPERAEASLLRMSIQAARGEWESTANILLCRARAAGGELTHDAVEALAKETRLLPPALAERIVAVNRPRQKVKPEDLLRHALTWPLRADAILSHLEGNLGWLRLYIAYLERVLAGVYRCARSYPGDQKALLLRCGEIIERDVAYPLAMGMGPPAGDVTLFREASSLDPTRKKRLSRQRERCLRGPLDASSDDWIDLLRDIAAANLSEVA